MSSFLRTGQIIRSLRSVTSTLHLAIRPQRAVCLVKPSPIVFARCLSVQPTSQVNNRPVIHNELENLLQKLDNDGHRFGNISRNLVHRIHEVVKKRSGMSPSQALLVIRCCGSLMPEELPAARTELAHEIWTTLESQGVSLDLSHYNALLRIYLENEFDFSPMDFLNSLQAKGLEPNRITYQRLVARFAQMGDIEGASKILEYMKDKNISINETVFNSLILGHARANDLPSAVDMLEVMRSSGLEPSVDTYSVLAVAQAEKGDLDGVKSTVAIAREYRQALHDRDLLEVVFAATVSGHKELVPEILSMVQKDWGYNQDSRNIIFRLLNAGCDAEARLVYATMETLSEQHSQSNFNNGLFFVRHLIMRDRPASTVVGLCDDLSGSSPHMLRRALETAVLHNAKLAYPLMDAIVSKGEELRPHYFWPLLAQCSAKGDIEGIKAVLENMNTRAVPITSMTLVDYVIPCLLAHGPSGFQGHVAAVHRIKDAGLMLRDAVNAVVRHNVMACDLKSAAEILRQFVFSLSTQLRRPLVFAICNTGAYEDAATVLGQMAWSRRGRQEFPEETKDGNAEAAAALEEDEPLQGHELRDDGDDIVGRVLLDLAIKMSSNNNSVDFAAFLKAVQQRGLSINRQSEAAITHRLGALATPEIIGLLDTLASGTLTRVELERGNMREMASVGELEARLKTIIAEDKDPKGVLITLLVAYAKDKNIEKAEETFKTLQDMQYPIGVGLRVVILDMYCALGLSQKAVDTYTAIRGSDPDATILPSKCLKVARLLVDEGKFDEAVAVMDAWGQTRASEEAPLEPQHDSEELDSGRISGQSNNENIIDIICGSMLKLVAEKGDLETVQRLVDTILRNKLAVPSRRLLSPIVNAHLAKEDVDAAMEATTRFWKDYKLLPNKQNLLCALIKREDTDKLRQLVDMGTEVHGEANSLLDLGLAFIEEGRYNEAKRIFSTPGLRLSQQRLKFACETYCRNKKFESLEALLRATVPVFGVDRRLLYQQALQAYINTGDCDNALGLWTQMQEEDVNVTDEFLYKLGVFLMDNNRDVPFAMPAVPSPQPSAPAPSSDRRRDAAVAAAPGRAGTRLNAVSFSDERSRTEEKYPLLREYRAIAKTSPVEEVMAFHAKLTDDPSIPIFPSDTANLAERLLDDNRLAEAVDTVKKAKGIRGRNFIRMNTLKRLLVQVTAAGDMDSILHFMTQSPEQEQGVFGHHLCQAATNSNRVDECLAFYEKRLDDLDSSSQDSIRKCSANFPKPGMLLLLNKDESLLSRLEEFAAKGKGKGVYSGQATLWAHHFSKGNTEKAYQIKQDLKDAKYPLPHIALCGLMRDTQDVSLAPRLLQELQETPDLCSSDATGRVYSTWIELHCKQDEPQQGLQVLETHLQRGTIASISRTSLSILSAALAAKNLPFTYTIPENRPREQQQQQQ